MTMLSTAQGIQSADPTVLHRLRVFLDRLAALPEQPAQQLVEALALATKRVAAVLPSMPAATLGSLALGLPHAHPAHTPGVALPPLGPLLVGASASVLINGRPAARGSALGISPTGAGLTPFFQVLTGSSSVLIGDERAVRASDLTAHCRPSSTVGTGGALGAALHSAHAAWSVVHQVKHTAELLAHGAAAAEATQAASQAEYPAERAAYLQQVRSSLTSAAIDPVQRQLSSVLEKAMGRDPSLPVGGTTGVLLTGSGNVHIGGLPTPSAQTVIFGLKRLLLLRAART